jgi:Mg-chelatase subunit ChlD
VSTGQCTEKEQRKREYRDYSCAPAGCTYTVTSESWIETGQTRNKANGTACNDGLFCTNPDVCTSGVCSGPSKNCSQYNLLPIETCLNIPDNKPFTWDYGAGFTSVCDETLDICTTGNQTITHECSIELCDAECEDNGDCGPSQCYVTFNDTCTGFKLTEYNGNKIKDSTQVSNSTPNICLGDCTCTDNPVTCNPPSTQTYCVKDVCGAVCDSNDDCANKCVGNIRYFTGTCNTCSDCKCSYQTEDCNLQDGWYNTSTYQWVSTGQCTEKEQRMKEYRDYSCDPSGCTYTVTSESWTDTGQTRNKPNGTTCNDNLYCTNPDVCTNGICGGVQRNCNDGLFCTVNDRCDEEHDTCAYDQRECSDNLFCTVNERCDEVHDTCASDQRNCSGNNLLPIATCFNNPDGINFTWDYAQGFTSTCNEQCDICTTGNQTITHECSIELCGAECEQDSDCEPYLSDSTCHFGEGCSGGCACEGGQDEFCPVPGTVVDSTCYYGMRSCTEEGCSIQSCTLQAGQICDPEEGCQGVPCEHPVSITDFWGGYAERLIYFPLGGGYNSSAKIFVPRSDNFSTISASVDLQGIQAFTNNKIVLVTDVSGSMDDNCGPDGIAQPGETPCKINDVKNATSQFIQSVLPLSDSIQIGLVSYRTSLASWLNLTRNETALLQEINTYHAEGFTCISCGIRKGADIASEGEGNGKSMILLSDGAANRCIAGACTPIIAKDEAINESRRAWEQLGVRVYVIAFADNGDLATLQQIADAGNGTLVIANVTEIIDKYKEMASIISDSYPTNPTLDIGNAGVDWSHASEFNTTDTLAFLSKLDSIRKDCNCSGCTAQGNLCVIDLKTYSETLGAIRFFNLNITGCCHAGGTCLLQNFCGDGSCNGEETCSSCQQDCGQCPPQCGDGVCDSGESCHSCSADCGTCGGGGGGCTPNWQCSDWSACCEDGTQKRLCLDANNCGTLAGKPQEIKFCIFAQAVPIDQGCKLGEQMCDKGSLMECTSEGNWVKVSDCEGGQQTQVNSYEGSNSQYSGMPVTGMILAYPWPYLLAGLGAAALWGIGGLRRARTASRPQRSKYNYKPK